METAARESLRRVGVRGVGSTERYREIHGESLKENTSMVFRPFCAFRIGNGYLYTPIELLKSLHVYTPLGDNVAVIKTLATYWHDFDFGPSLAARPAFQVYM